MSTTSQLESDFSLSEGNNFCLKWDGFHNNMTTVFDVLRKDEELVDLTLCCEGHKFKVHKIVLSASSPFFKDLIKENPCAHPVFVLRDTRRTDLAAILEFVYRGNVNVSQTQLASFIQTAELLQVRGLSGDDDRQKDCYGTAPTGEPETPEPAPSSGSLGGAADCPTGHRAASTPAATPAHTIHRTSDTPVSPSAVRAVTPPPKRRRTSPQPPQPLPPPPPPQLVAAAAGVPPPSRLAATKEVDGCGPRVPSVDQGVKMEKVEVFDVEDESAFDDVVSYGRSGERLEQVLAAAGQLPLTGATGLPGMLPSLGQGVTVASVSTGAGDDASQGGGSTSWRCLVCGAAYKSQYSLMQHARVHEGLTLCPVCGVAQSRVTNLRRHLMIKHSLSRERATELVPHGQRA